MTDSQDYDQQEYFYCWNGQYYRNNVKLIREKLKETDEVSIKRIILSYLIKGCSFHRTKARKIIDEIREGIIYTIFGKIIKFRENPYYFYEEGSQSIWDDSSLFFHILQNSSYVQKKLIFKKYDYTKQVMSLEKIKNNLLSSNVLFDDEIEELNSFWNGDSYIRVLNGLVHPPRYMFVIDDKIYLDGQESNSGPDDIPAERSILEAYIGDRHKIRKTQVGRYIREIKNGIGYSVENHPVKYDPQKDIFILNFGDDEDFEQYTQAELFLTFVRKANNIVKKIE